MELRFLNLELTENIAVISINNPGAMNSIDLECVYEIQNAIDFLEKNHETRCAILTGTGDKAFTAGGDVKSERDFPPDKISEYNHQGWVIVRKIMNSRIPYIAAVNGYAFGAGIALITACDISVAAHDAVFCFGTPSLGGIPGWGCTQVTARIVGAQNAKMLLLANEKISAAEACQMGLINKVVRKEVLMPEAMKYAQTISGFAQNAMKALKYAVNNGLEVSLEEGIRIEAEVLDKCNNERNFKEGITAFLEKRKPVFRQEAE